MASPLRMALTRLVIALRRSKDWLIATAIFSLLRVLSLLPADRAISSSIPWRGAESAR